jgi:hypothetical protein
VAQPRLGLDFTNSWRTETGSNWSDSTVAIEYGKVKWAERDGDRWVVVEATKEELEALPVFDRMPYDPAPAPAPEATGSITPAPTAPAQ